jgi:hypothetical protein
MENVNNMLWEIYNFNSKEEQVVVDGVQSALPTTTQNAEELTNEVANVTTQVSHQSQVIPHHGQHLAPQV